MRRIVILGAVVLAVIVVWTAGWFYVANEARKAIVALADSGGTGTPTLTCGNLGIGGYPFRLDITCGPATIAVEDVTATIEEVRASVLVYRLNQVLLFAKGPLLVEDAFSGAQSRLTWASFDSSLRLTDWRIARFSLVVENLNWADTLATEALIANAGHLEVHLIDVPERLDRDSGTAALTLVGRLTGLTAPGLEINAGDTELQAEITAVPDELVRFAEPDALQRWQAAGGAVSLSALRSEDGTNFLEAAGDVNLDSTGRPEGQIVVKSKGVVERFEGAVAPELRPLILGTREADGSYSQTFTMSGGLVLSGLMPAGTLPALW